MKCPDAVVEAVREDLLARSLLGVKKYGTVLYDNPLSHREWLQHAYEEALDLANYLKCAIMESDRAMGYQKVVASPPKAD